VAIIRLPLIALLLLFGTAEQATRSFEDDNAGKPPAGFLLAVGRDGPPGRWVVEREADNQVLTFTGDATSSTGFGIAVAQEAYEDVEASVRLRLRQGSRRAGLLVRYVDPLNHYAVQLNLAAQELAVYRVIAGNRIRVDRHDELELDPEAWHTLRVVCDGDSLRVSLGGIPVFRERDRAFRGSGAVGLWAAADAVVSFDDLRIERRTGRGR
jgi:hypothetical protein